MQRVNARWAIRLQFGIAAVAFGLWGLRVAEFRAKTGLSHQELGMLILIAPIALQLTLTQMPRISRFLGTRRMILVGFVLMQICILILSSFPPWTIIALTFALLGAAMGILEIGLNTIAQKLDRETGALMLSAHGFWSIGLTFGMVLAGALAELGVSFLIQELITIPILLALSIWFIAPLPLAKASEKEQGFSLPTLAILPICLIPTAALFFEGSVTDWGSVFLIEERATSPFETGVITGLYMAGMAAIRLLGDRLRHHFHAITLLVASTIASTLGLIAFAASSSIALISIGALIGGIGCGVVYPLTLVLINEGREESEATELIAAVASVSFVAFLFAPPFMGFVAEYYSLEIAFLALVPLTMLTLLWIFLANQKH